MKRSTAVSLAFVISAATLASASSSGFSMTWKAPDAGELNLRDRKVAALVLSDTRSVRLGGEDALAKAITDQGAAGVAAYTIVPLGAEKDKDRAKELMSKAGVVAVVAMRAVGKEQTMTAGSAPGGTYATDSVYVSLWGGYYAWGWGGVYDPGYLRNDTVVSVETLVYSLEGDKLVWAGTSETVNPKGIDGFVRKLAGKAAKEMRKQGLIR